MHPIFYKASSLFLHQAHHFRRNCFSETKTKLWLLFWNCPLFGVFQLWNLLLPSTTHVTYFIYIIICWANCEVDRPSKQIILWIRGSVLLKVIDRSTDSFMFHRRFNTIGSETYRYLKPKSRLAGDFSIHETRP